MNTIRRLVQNSIFSLVSSLILRLSSAVLFIVIARKLGEEAAGVYSLATTYTMIFLSLSLWGLDQLFIRDVSRKRTLAAKYLINFGGLRLLMAGVNIGLLFAFVLVLDRYSPDTIKAIMLMGLTLISDGWDNICQAYFIAVEDMVYIPLASLTLALFRLIGIAAIAWYGDIAVETVVWVFIVASIARGLMSSWLVFKKLAPPTFDIDSALWLSSIVGAIPFVFINAFITLESQLGTVLISILASEREVGLYGAAQTIVVALQIIPQAIRSAIFPAMSRLHAQSADSFNLLYRQSFLYLLILSLGLVPCVIIVAPDLTVLLYKQPFAPATLSLQILAVSLAFRLLNIPNSRLMIIANQQKWLALFLGLGLVGNLFVSLLFIPRFGFQVAAVGQLASMVIFFLANSLFVYRRVLKIRFTPWITRVPIALGASLGIDLLLLTYDVPLLVTALAGLVIYVGVLIATNTIPQEDIRLFRQLLQVRARTD
jgi:O-antigen/teichoic acid export membrane protein